MTILATGSETRVAYVAETVPGTTPATPTMTVLPTVKLDLTLNQTTLEDTSIYSDRMQRYAVAGQRKVTGSFAGNFSHTNFNALMSTAMFAQPTSKVWKTGTALQTITLEQWHSDITKGVVYTGCFADKLQVKVPTDGFVTFDGTINGFNASLETTALSATPTAATVETPFSPVAATITEGGSTIAYVTAIDLTIDNASKAEEVIGAQAPIGYTAGMSKITFTLSAYFPDTSLYTKYINSTSSAITFTLSDGTNTVEFNLPKVQYTSVKTPVSGQTAIIQAITGVALFDSVSGSNIVVTYS